MGGGYLTIGRWGGAPVRLHWTLPLGALLFGRGRLALGFFVGFALLVLAHELGHALLVRRFRHRVVSIDLHGLGGECRWEGDATPVQRARIAWGGVNAQLVLLAAAEIAHAALGPATTPFVADLGGVFTMTNVFMIAVNLLPVPPLDGAEAWKLPRLLWARSRRRAARTVARPTREAERELAQLDARELTADTAATNAAVEARLRELAREPRPTDAKSRKPS